MHIIYVSNLCTQKTFYKHFENSNLIPGQQVQKYHRLLVEGFSKNDVHVSTVSAPPITRENTKKVFIKLKTERVDNVEYNYLPVINLPFIKNFFVILFSFFKTLFLCLKHKQVIIVCDVLNISVTFGALLASKLCAVHATGIVTDIPAMILDKKWVVRINNAIINSFSSYIFLTKQMNDSFNKKHRPYLVVEGQVDINMKDFDNQLANKYDKKVCIYAGALNKIYGVERLVHGFIHAKIDNAELHIYGNGDYEDELKDICKENHNIKYFGVVPNDIVINEELKATLLINPRPSDAEFTKYSFPSKNMEYMVSGTPVLTTILPGMPKEYQEYVYVIDDESVAGIANSLKEVLGKPNDELHHKGLMAKKFVLEQKNNVYQTKKIIDEPKAEVRNYYKLAKTIFNNLQIYLIMALFFFVFFNFNHQGLKILYDFGLPLAIISLLFNPRVSKWFLLGLFLIIAFEISYHQIVEYHGHSFSLYKGLPTIIYSLGYLALNGQKTESNLKKAQYLILFVVLVLFLYGTTNFLVHFLIIKPRLAEDPGRLIYDIWGREFLAATNQGSKFTMALGLLPLVFFTKLKPILRISFVIATVISITAMVFYGNRSGFVLILLNFMLCAVIYYFLQYKNKVNFRKQLKQIASIALIFIVIISTLFLFYQFNVLKFKDILNSTELFKKVSPELINDPRLTYWKIAFIGMFKYPFGGYLTQGLTEHYAHNLWLDTAYATGVIPFGFLLILSVLYLILIIKLFINKKMKDDFKLFMIAISFPLFLNYMIEPIIEGYFIMFLCIFIFGGLFLKIHERNKAIS